MIWRKVYGEHRFLKHATIEMPNWSASVVEQTGARMFGLEESEAIDRRRYVRQVRKELEVRQS